MSDLPRIALNRFGLGARPGERAALQGDPRGWVAAQVGAIDSRAAAALHTLPDARSRSRSIRALFDEAEDERTGRRTVRRAARELLQQEAAARTRAAVESETPFVERWVRFWSNHFTVSARKPQVMGVAGAFEREVIRPRVWGRFSDLLLASSRHPAMLIYLDNAGSIGPDSPAGQRRGRGLNENLAREILELHTLGVDGGYDQADVEALASILTGWSVSGPRSDHPGLFEYRRRTHQPGAKRLLGRTWPEAGEEEGVAALAALAAAPQTARHLAGRLAQAFIADDPPPAIVDHLTERWLDSRGDLSVVAQALVQHPLAWRQSDDRLRSPDELIVAAGRLLAYPDLDGRSLLSSLDALGQTPLSAPSPAGWPLSSDSWLGPEAILRRIEWAEQVGRAAPAPAIDQLLDQAFSPGEARATRAAVRAAGSPQLGLALLLASPDFQRR